MCEYCEKPFKDMSQDEGTDAFSLVSWNEDWHIINYADFSGPINYCPMCGRKLKEAKR